MGLPGRAGDPLVPARLKDMHTQCPVSASDWLSPEANFEDLRQSQQLGRGLQCHEQPGDVTQGGSPFFFFPMQEPGASRARTGEQGQSKGRRCLIHCVGNPGHSSSQGATDAKILPEFRETREIHGLKNHQALLSAMAVLQRAARAAPSRAGRACWGLCTPCITCPGHVPPRWEEGLSLASRRGAALKQQTCTLVSAVQTPYALPHPCVLWLLLLRKPKRVPLQAAQAHHPQNTLHLTRLSVPSLPGDTRATRSKREWLPIPLSPAQP